MAEQDQVTSLITNNMISTLDGRDLEYLDRVNTITCEHQRRIDPLDTSLSPYVTCNFISTDRISKSSAGKKWKGIWTTNLVIDEHDDRYDPNNAKEPITEVCQNVMGYIINYLLEDITRGGNCIQMDVIQFGGGIIDWEDGNFVYMGFALFEAEYFTQKDDMFVRIG